MGTPFAYGGSVQQGGHDNHAIREAVLLALGCIVTLVWSASTIVPLVWPSRQVDSGVHLVMLTVAGGLFGAAAIAGRKSTTNGNGKPKGGNGGA